MGTFLYLLAAFVALLYYLVKKRYNYWTDRGFVSPPSVFPFGSLKDVSTKVNIVEKLDIIYKQFKGKTSIVGGYFFFHPTAFVIDPEVIKSILVRDFNSFHDRGFFYNKVDQPVSANILTLDGQEWRDRRTKLTPAFTSGKMKMMFDIVNLISDRLVDSVRKDVEKSEAVEMRVWSSKYTSDVIGNVAFGIECNCMEDPNSEFFKNGRKIFDLSAIDSLKFILVLGNPKLGRMLRLHAFATEPSNFFYQTFLNTLNHREKNIIERNDFVSLLLGLKKYFTRDELAAEAFLFYNAGFETSSTLTQFTLYELALNPEIQDRLRNEIKNRLEENDGKLTYDLLQDLSYLNMVVQESLRKYPPIVTLNRRCIKDYPIPNTNLMIPKGAAVNIPIYSLHHDSEYYPEPEKFDPERFTPENVKARDPFTFLPFGEGPRNCIGLRFGLMQSKLGIVKILQNYELSPSEKTPIPMRFVPSSPFLAPVGGMYLNLKIIK